MPTAKNSEGARFWRNILPRSAWVRLSGTGIRFVWRRWTARRRRRGTPNRSCSRITRSILSSYSSPFLCLRGALIFIRPILESGTSYRSGCSDRMSEISPTRPSLIISIFLFFVSFSIIFLPFLLPSFFFYFKSDSLCWKRPLLFQPNFISLHYEIFVRRSRHAVR